MLLMKKVFALWAPLLIALAEPAAACTTVKNIMEIQALQGSTATLCPFDFTNDNGGCGPNAIKDQKRITFINYPNGYTGAGGIHSVTTSLTCLAGGTCKISCTGYKRIGIFMDAHNTLNLIGGFHFESHTAGAIRNTGGKLYVKGATFKDNKGEKGAAILTWWYSNRGSTTVEDCHFEGNSASFYGGALYGSSTTLKVIGCTFKNNKGAKSGGAIFGEKSGSLGAEFFSQVEITSSTFEGNTAPWGPTIAGLDNCQVVFKTDISTSGTAFIGTSSCDGVAIGSDANCDTAPIVPSDFATCPKANTLPVDFFHTPAPMTDAPTKAPTPAPKSKSTVCEGERLISEKAFCHNGGAKNLEGSYTTEECIQSCVAEGAKFVASANQASSSNDQRCTCFMKDTCDKKPQNSFDLYKACTLSTTPKSVAVPPQAAPSSAPTKSPTVASSSGDPHFKTWSGAKFDYHGECDLVLLDNPSFNNGQGLKVHIRTTRVQYYSYIEKIAVKIGDDVLEFANDAENFVLNGSPPEPKRRHHETLLGGFVLRRDHKSISIRLHGDRHNRDAIAKIDFHSRKNGFPGVIVDGGNTDVFKGSLGLLGDWETGSKLARDGVTEIAVGEDGNATTYALEWQVRDTEPMLFQEARFPQFPTQCTPPKKILGGRLGKSHMKELAQKACADFNGDKDDCVFDVIATRSAAAASQE